MIILSKCGYAESLQNSVNFWVITKEFSTIEDLLVNFAEDLFHIFRIENKGLFSHASALTIDNPFKDWILNLCNGVCDGSYSSYYFEEVILALILDKDKLERDKDRIEIIHCEDNTRRVELKWLTKP